MERSLSERPYREAPNYTQAFLWMAGLSLFILLFTLWAIFGYIVSLISGWGVHLLINRLPRRS